mgnify:CR=1 FL=1
MEAQVRSLLKKVEEGLGVALFCAILFSILWQIALRYFFNAPPSWTEELSRLLFIYMGTIGVHLTQLEYTHVRSDMLVSGVRPGVRKVLETLILLVSAVSMAALAWFSVQMTVRKAPIQLVSLNVSSAFMYINAALVSALTAVAMIRQFLWIVGGRADKVYRAEEAATGEARK